MLNFTSKERFHADEKHDLHLGGERGGNFLLSPASAPGEVRYIIPFLTGLYLLQETTF